MPNIPEAPKAAARPDRSLLKQVGAGLASLAVATTVMTPMTDMFKNAAVEAGNAISHTATTVGHVAAKGLNAVMSGMASDAYAGQEWAISGTAISNGVKSVVHAGIDTLFGIKKPDVSPALMKEYQKAIGNQQQLLDLRADPATNSVKMTFDERMGPMQIRTEIERGAKNELKLTQPNYNGGTLGLTHLEIKAKLDPTSGAVIPESVEAAGVDAKKQPDRQAKAVALAQRQAGTSNNMLKTIGTTAQNYNAQAQQKAAAQQTQHNMPASRETMKSGNPYNYNIGGFAGGGPK